MPPKRGLAARLLGPVTTGAAAVTAKARVAAEAKAERARIAAEKRRSERKRNLIIAGSVLGGVLVLSLTVSGISSVVLLGTQDVSAQVASTKTTTPKAAASPSAAPSPVGTPTTSENPAGDQSAVDVLATLKVAPQSA